MDSMRAQQKPITRTTVQGRTLLFVVTEDWYFRLHWLHLAVAAKAAGHRVTVLTRVSEDADRIRAEGLELVPFDLRRRSRNPLHAIADVIRLTRVYRRLRPDLVQHVAIKPVLFGSLAARLAGVPAVVNTAAGLGYVFSSSDVAARLLRPFVTLAYRFALAPRRHRLVLQNHDDLAFFVRRARVDPQRAIVIPGVGVDTVRFRPEPEPDGPARVLMPARLLRDKGIHEFVEAARLLHARGVPVRFSVAGDRDPHNPASASEEQLHAWMAEGQVDFLGWQQDMASLLRASHIIALPSYREGLPTALTEAASCGRPIVTCDVPGCREVVVDGENGFLVPPRDAAALARAIERLAIDADLRARMGRCGRQRAELLFSVEHVQAVTLDLYRVS